MKWYLLQRDNSNATNTVDVWLEELMDQYGNALVNLAYTYVKDWGKAQEIVQDVFVTCYEQYEKLNQIHSYKAWIYRITINRAKDATRSSWFKRVLVLNKFFSHIQSEQPSPEIIVNTNQSNLQLAEAVLSLPQKYREVILLYYYEQLSVKEISDVLHKNENTIKTRLTRARELLKTKLEESGFNE